MTGRPRAIMIAGAQGPQAIRRRMLAFVVIGVLLSLGGLAGILWCIRQAALLRRRGMPDSDLRAGLGRLVYAHTASIGAAFLGLGLLVVGLLLG